jgi:hypothetical protein
MFKLSAEVGAIRTKEGQIHIFPLQEADMQVAGVLGSNQIPIGKVEAARDLARSVDGTAVIMIVFELGIS